MVLFTKSHVLFVLPQFLIILSKQCDINSEFMHKHRIGANYLSWLSERKSIWTCPKMPNYFYWQQESRQNVWTQLKKGLNTLDTFNQTSLEVNAVWTHAGFMAVNWPNLWGISKSGVQLLFPKVYEIKLLLVMISYRFSVFCTHVFSFPDSRSDCSLQLQDNPVTWQNPWQGTPR